MEILRRIQSKYVLSIENVYKIYIVGLVVVTINQLLYSLFSLYSVTGGALLGGGIEGCGFDPIIFNSWLIDSLFSPSP